MPILRPSVANLRGLGNWSQTFRWSVQFVSLPSGLDGGIMTAEDINFRAESMSVPEKEIETTEIMIRGNRIRQEGIGNYVSPITLTLVETIEPKVLMFLNAWQELAWKTRGGSPGTTSYKKNIECTIRLYHLDNEDQPFYSYILYGCQIANATKGELDAQNADPLKPQLSIAYDFFETNADRSSFKDSYLTTESNIKSMTV